MVRWFQWATFCPVMRLHGDREPRQPRVGDTNGAFCRSGADNEVWSYGEEVYEIFKKYMGIREELRDYTRGLMKEAHEKGSPVMRTLFNEFLGDSKCWEVETQYMYGEKYLCAPVMESKTVQQEVYLPKIQSGKWASYWTKEEFDGGQTVVVQCPMDTMPVFVRPS